MSIIVLENINKIYGKGENQNKALKDVNLTIEKGEFVAIVGTSGSGKSTLLNILGCLDKPTSGKYFLEGQDVINLSDKKIAKVRNEKIGFVFQDFNLINEKSILDNVIVPLKFSKKFKGSKKKKALEMLKNVGLKGHEKKKPCGLSGGEMQRAAIVRALINEPDIILADEPTGSLDKKNGNMVMDLFEEINNQGKTVIIITHDHNIASRCKRILNVDDGKIY